MKSTIALAAAGLIALSVPAFAQNAGAPGATGTGTGLSGSNTGTSPGTSNTESNKMGGASGGGMNEGRATSPDMSNTPGDKANPAPSTVRGDQNGQGKAKP